MTPRTAAFTLAALLSLAIASDLLWMPVQVYDSVDEILGAQASPSVSTSFAEDLRADDRRVRALRVAQTKLLYDVSAGGRYRLIYRGFHAALLIAAVLLFTAALRVSTRIDLAAAAFALVVLVGLRSFRGNLQEAFPINPMIEIAAWCLLTLNLARSRGGWWVDAAAVLALAAAALTLETGLLVWVIAAGAWAVGWRGISMRAIAAMTLVVAAYAYLRFGVLGIGTPGLPDRATGYLLSMLEPEDLQRRFGDSALWLYFYNVTVSALSVLLSEPSGGVFVTARAWLAGDPLPRVVIPVVTSAATTTLMIWTAVRLVRQRRMDDTARFLVLLAVVLPANAVLAYSYTKDEIMGVAGVFYALAAFAAARAALHWVERAPKLAAAAVLTAVAVLATGWSVRAAGMHYLMRTQAFRHQNDWVHMPGEWKRQGRWPDQPAAQQLIRQLRDAAVRMEVPNPGVGERRWVGRVWED